MTTFNALHLNAFIAGYFEALYFAESATNCDGETFENVAVKPFSNFDVATVRIQNEIYLIDTQIDVVHV